eukprot:6189043-Pleurochrysis_carterae.AAC.3
MHMHVRQWTQWLRQLQEATRSLDNNENKSKNMQEPQEAHVHASHTTSGSWPGPAGAIDT